MIKNVDSCLDMNGNKIKVGDDVTNLCYFDSELYFKYSKVSFGVYSRS